MTLSEKTFYFWSYVFENKSQKRFREFFSRNDREVRGDKNKYIQLQKFSKEKIAIFAAVLHIFLYVDKIFQSRFSRLTAGHTNLNRRSLRNDLKELDSVRAAVNVTSVNSSALDAAKCLVRERTLGKRENYFNQFKALINFNSSREDGRKCLGSSSQKNPLRVRTDIKIICGRVRCDSKTKKKKKRIRENTSCVTRGEFARYIFGREKFLESRAHKFAKFAERERNPLPRKCLPLLTYPRDLFISLFTPSIAHPPQNRTFYSRDASIPACDTRDANFTQRARASLMHIFEDTWRERSYLTSTLSLSLSMPIYCCALCARRLVIRIR